MKFKTQELNSIAAKLLDAGYRIFHTGDPHWNSHFYFSDGVHIGSCHSPDYGGVKFSTVHRPCKEAGTGFSLQDYWESLDNPTLEDARRAMYMRTPDWASRDTVAAVVKYTSLEAFLKHTLGGNGYIELTKDQFDYNENNTATGNNDR